MPPPPPPDRTAPATMPEYCKKCRTSYSTWKAYHIHLLQSRFHSACVACGADFHSSEALKYHHDMMHPAEQNLNCPGCMKSFTRLGGLIAHLEQLECHAIQPDLFAVRKAAITLKSGKFDAIRAATAWGAPVMAGSGGLQPLIDTSTPVESASGIHGAFQPALAAAGPPPVSKASGDPFGITLNSSWDDETLVKAPVISQSDFPMLAPSSIPNQQVKASTTQGRMLGVVPKAQTPSQLYVPYLARSTQTPTWNKAQQPTSSPNLTNVVPIKSVGQVSTANQWLKASTTQPNPWTIQKHLFLNAPPTVTPPTELMGQLTVTAATEKSIEKHHDPNTSNFQPTKYWNAFTQSYKCPRAGCKKSFKTVAAFTQHLSSPAHTVIEKLKCPYCLRQFASATALTQHSESQGVNCKIRNVGAYQYHVEEMTAEFATTDGWHEDNTVRYAVKPLGPAVAVSGTQKVIEANLRAEEAKKGKKENYWKTKEYSKW